MSDLGPDIAALRREIFASARRVVVKVGSAVLAPKGQLDPSAVADLADDIAAVLQSPAQGPRRRQTPRQIVLVSSGAVASGFRLLGLKSPPKLIQQKQAAAAIGQQRLMRAYADAFDRHARAVGQVLLTADDLDHRVRFLNARHTLQTLLDAGAIPIINENDSVSFQEIKLGDNDRLSALVAGLVDADALIILSTVEGLYESWSPGRAGAVIPMVPDIAAARVHIGAGKSETGVGGMETKLLAAAIATGSGMPAFIAGGRLPNVLARLFAGEALGTFFPVTSRARGTSAALAASPARASAGPSARKRWIGFSARAKGKVVVDAGARRALMERGASLLPSGITAVLGSFDAGVTVEIVGPDRAPFARGVTRYASDEIDRIKGQHARAIRAILGQAICDEVIHRDDLAILGN